MRRHCDDVGRDPDQIEVTALPMIDDAGPDTLLRHAEEFAAVGVHTIMARSTQPQPDRWLEEVWGPVVDKLGAIETA